MPHWSQEAMGAATAPVATIMFAQASSVQALPVNDRRISFTIQNATATPIYLGYGSTAVASQSAPILPANNTLEDRDWNGAVNTVAAAGTIPFFITELSA